MSVQSVLGEVKAEQLGITLTHEHLSMEFKDFYKSPPAIFKNKFTDGIGLHNLAYISQYPYSSRLNLDYTLSESAMKEEVRLFSEAGGSTIVENTTWGLGRDLKLMKNISKATGVNIIAGTGHYVADTQRGDTLQMSVEKMVDLIRNELINGCDEDPETKCGVVGEVASSWPIHEFEKKCIIATGIAQSELNCPVTFHPGRNKEAPFEILRLYSEAGGSIKKAVMSHLDRTISSTDDLIEFAKLGSYCQFDLFGTEVSFYQLAPELDMPSDAQRIDRIILLQEAGKQDKILVSHDIHTRHRLVQYGGHGFAHILVSAKEKMLIKGISEENINKILVKNPATWLTSQ